MGYGYDAMWLPVLEGVVDRADWMDGWQAGRQAGVVDGRNAKLRRVLLVWRKRVNVNGRQRGAGRVVSSFWL